jgi:hypothetical protein
MQHAFASLLTVIPPSVEFVARRMLDTSALTRQLKSIGGERKSHAKEPRHVSCTVAVLADLKPQEFTEDWTQTPRGSLHAKEPRHETTGIHRGLDSDTTWLSELHVATLSGTDNKRMRAIDHTFKLLLDFFFLFFFVFFLSLKRARGRMQH